MVITVMMATLVRRGSCCMFALQMSYFAVGNATMAVTDADVSPVGVVCNVTQVCTNAPSLRGSAEAAVLMSAEPSSSLLRQPELF